VSDRKRPPREGRRRSPRRNWRTRFPRATRCNRGTSNRLRCRRTTGCARRVFPLRAFRDKHVRQPTHRAAFLCDGEWSDPSPACFQAGDEEHQKMLRPNYHPTSRTPKAAAGAGFDAAKRSELSSSDCYVGRVCLSFRASVQRVDSLDYRLTKSPARSIGTSVMPTPLFRATNFARAVCVDTERRSGAQPVAHIEPSWK
jgi:hypothetical protein